MKNGLAHWQVRTRRWTGWKNSKSNCCNIEFAQVRRPALRCCVEFRDAVCPKARQMRFEHLKLNRSLTAYLKLYLRSARFWLLCRKLCRIPHFQQRRMSAKVSHGTRFL